MIQVRYIGLKPTKTDNVAGTDAVWNGPGSVQEVSDAAWEKLKKHPSVWQLADAPYEPTETASGPKFFLPTEDGGVLNLDELNDQKLRQLAKSQNWDIDGRLRGDKLREAIVAAYDAAVKAAAKTEA